MGCGPCGGSNAQNFSRGSAFSDAHKQGHIEIDDHNMAKEKDSLVKFEKRYPLYKIHVNAWSTKLIENGNHTVTSENLKNIFRSPAFQGKFEKEHEFYKLLCSLPKCSDDSFNCRTLELLGVSWCTGSPEEKIEALYKVLQPDGQDGTNIASNDQDIPDTIETLIEIQTLFTLQKCQEFPESANPQNDSLPHNKQMERTLKYCMSKDEEDTLFVRKIIQYMRKSDIDDPKEISGFIGGVFGYESKLTHDQFVDKMLHGENNWIYQPKACRIKMNNFLADEYQEKLEEEIE